jgi:hypothetical protein
VNEPVLSRDCPEFESDLPGDRLLIVLGNHFKSQGYGHRADNDARRLDQSGAVVSIYLAARQRTPFVAVMGDLNAGVGRASLAPLFAGTGLGTS